jgi:hypothetical protein
MKTILAFILGNIVGGLGMFFWLSLKGKVQDVGKRKV